jgi:hypothetical protein
MIPIRRALTVLLIVAAPAVLLPIGWMLAPAEALWDSLLHIPYRVDSHFAEYSGDGTVTNRHTLTSFMSDGKEIALSHTFPADWLRTAIRTGFDELGIIVFRGIAEPVARLQGEVALASDLEEHGCVVGGSDVVANETLLGYDTVLIEWNSRDERVRTWRAPRLGCFPLRVTIEARRGDRSQLRFERTAVRVRQHY